MGVPGGLWRHPSPGRRDSARAHPPAGAAGAAAAQNEEAEKQILRAAQALQGKITTSLAALNTTLSMKQAQEILERMTKEGHAVMNVTGEGIIEFEFPEFLPHRQIRSP